jgi:hypothetical protein
MPETPRRFAALRARLTLVILGLALGVAARWIGGLLENQVKEPYFKPMIAEPAGEEADEDR